MTISKGGEMIGFICWHPSAKRLVFCGHTAQTKAQLEFVAKKMDQFYFCMKLDRLLKSQAMTDYKPV
jgi:hypothetical protein